MSTDHSSDLYHKCHTNVNKSCLSIQSKQEFPDIFSNLAHSVIFFSFSLSQSANLLIVGMDIAMKRQRSVTERILAFTHADPFCLGKTVQACFKFIRQS